MSLPPHWCSICGKDLQSARSLAEHEAGRKHRRKAGLPVRPRCRWAPLTEEELFDGLAAGTYRRVVVCTGAGVSVAAGIPDFRSKGGLFETIRSRFGDRFPEVLSRPETLLSRSFVTRHPDAWRDEISPWLATWKQSAARPTPTHRFCRWLHDQGVLVRLYTQNVDGLHTHEEFDGDSSWAEKVVECHGSIRDGSIVLYGDALPPRVAHCLVEDFGGASDVDLVLVFGTSLQVAPFCAIPNLAPRGCARVLVNLSLDDCLANAWSRAPSRRKHLRLDCYGGPGHCGVGQASSMKLAGRAVQLGALWTDDRRWRQLLCGEACDAWTARFFASAACAARGHRPPAGFRRAHGVGAGEEGSGDEEGPAGVLERALVGKLL